MGTLWNDLRYGARMLIRNPGFTVVVALTLGIGIGANTAIYSVFTTILLRPLPYRQPEQLVWLANTNPALGVNQTFLNPQDILDYREQAQSFAEVASWGTYPVNLAGGREPERVESIYVTTNFFQTLGVTPLLGRDFSPEEGAEGSAAVIISYELWQRQFGGDAEIIGKKIVLAGNAAQPRVIVGVMPKELIFPPRVDLFETYQLERDPDRGGTHNDRTIARLKAGTTVEQAQAEISAIALRQAEQFPDTNKGWGVTLVPFQEHLFGSAYVALPLLFGAVAILLLIASTNVAGLQLAHAISRQKEIAIRLAVGAGRGHLIRQMLIESLLLSAIGGALGLLLAWWSVDVLRVLGGEVVPRLKDTRLDAGAFLFTAMLAIFTGVVFGLVPALQASKPDLNRMLKDSGGARIGGARPQRLRSLLIVWQFAMAMVLLAGAGLLIKSFWMLQQTSPGFQADQVFAAGVSLNMEEYRDTTRRRQFYQELLGRLTDLPGVEAAAAISHLPFGGRTLQQNFRIEGREPVSKQNQALADYRVITPTFFETLRIPIRRGRGFTEQDTAKAPIVYIVNEAFADAYFSGGEAVGEKIRLGYEGQWPGEVVGVAGDVKHRTMEAVAIPTIYVCYLQIDRLPSFPIMNYVVRAKKDAPGLLAESLRRELQSANGNQVVFYSRPLNDFIADTTGQRKFNMLLLGIFAFVALSLSAVGIYGLISYQITHRQREIAIRTALGARAGDILRMLLWQGLKLALAGVAVGTLGALAVVRLLQSMLYGVGPTDVSTFLTVALILTGAAILACCLPARRATKVDPLMALRHE